MCCYFRQLSATPLVGQQCRRGDLLAVRRRVTRGKRAGAPRQDRGGSWRAIRTATSPRALVQVRSTFAHHGYDEPGVGVPGTDAGITRVCTIVTSLFRNDPSDEFSINKKQSRGKVSEVKEKAEEPSYRRSSSAQRDQIDMSTCTIFFGCSHIPDTTCNSHANAPHSWLTRRTIRCPKENSKFSIY